MASKIDNAKTDALEMVRAHNKGALALELAQRLQEVGAAVKETGKKGTVTLKMSLSPNKKLVGKAVMFELDIACTLPKPDRRAEVKFLDADGCMVNDDPDQMRFDQVPGGKSFQQA